MMELPTALRGFAATLQAEGIALYAVGGCVRDALLQRPVHDVDLCSRLRPEALIARAAAYGIEAHLVQKTLGTVLLKADGQTFEHTTFRTESYGAGGAHRPDAVTFADTPEADAYRRDFSVNALYWCVATEKLVDPTGGREDLKRRVLRTTTEDPAVILRDDGLRILRLARFACTLGFSVDPDTWNAAKDNASLLQDVAWERKRQELDRILLCERVFDGLMRIKDVGALPYLLPECAACDGMPQRIDHHKYDVLTHLFHTCENTPNDLANRLTGLLHDIGKPEAKRRDGNLYAHDVYGERMAREAMERLRYPNALIERVCFAIRAHMFDIADAASDATVRKRFAQWGRARTEDVIMIREADVRGSGYKLGFRAEHWRRVYGQMQKEGAPFSESELKVTGEDIMQALGLDAGARVGRIKRQLLLHCAVHPEENRKELLIKRMRDYV